MTFTTIARRAAAPTSRSFDRSFERFVNDAFSSGNPANFSVEQTEAAWTVTFDLPGVPREELAINIEGAVVRIDTKAEAKRRFNAAYELPTEIDADASEAKLENGVLTLTLVKKVPVSNARALPIK